MAAPKRNLAASARKLQIIDRERRAVKGVVLHNGSIDEVQEVKCGGDKPGCMTFSFQPGDNEIHDVYGTPQKIAKSLMKEKKFGSDGHKGPKTELVVSALDIAAHAEAKLGHRGLVILSGPDSEDKKRRTQARKDWLRARITEERQYLDGYYRRVKAFQMSPRNLGKDDPVMNDREIEAQTFLDQHDRTVSGTKRFVCRFRCGFHTDEVTDMETHLEARHAEQILAEAREDNGEPAPPKRGPGRPPKAKPLKVDQPVEAAAS